MLSRSEQPRHTGLGWTGWPGPLAHCSEMSGLLRLKTPDSSEQSCTRVDSGALRQAASVGKAPDPLVLFNTLVEGAEQDQSGRRPAPRGMLMRSEAVLWG